MKKNTMVDVTRVLHPICVNPFDNFNVVRNKRWYIAFQHGRIPFDYIFVVHLGLIILADHCGRSRRNAYDKWRIWSLATRPETPFGHFRMADSIDIEYIDDFPILMGNIMDGEGGSGWMMEWMIGISKKEQEQTTKIVFECIYSSIIVRYRNHHCLVESRCHRPRSRIRSTQNRPQMMADCTLMWPHFHAIRIHQWHAPDRIVVRLRMERWSWEAIMYTHSKFTPKVTLYLVIYSGQRQFRCTHIIFGVTIILIQQSKSLPPTTYL